MKAIFFPFRSAIVRIGESFRTKIPSASGVGNSYAVYTRGAPAAKAKTGGTSPTCPKSIEPRFKPSRSCGPATQLGVETTSLVAVLGAAGLAIGLALQGSLSNFASGILLIVFRPVRVGDFVDAGGATGTVRDIQIFTTQLTTSDNKLVIVPNSKIMGDKIVNHNALGTRRIELEVPVPSDKDAFEVCNKMQQLVTADKRVLQNPSPEVQVTGASRADAKVVLGAWVNSSDYGSVNQSIQERVLKDVA